MPGSVWPLGSGGNAGTLTSSPSINFLIVVAGIKYLPHRVLGRKLYAWRVPDLIQAIIVEWWTPKIGAASLGVRNWQVSGISITSPVLNHPVDYDSEGQSGKEYNSYNQA